MRSEKSVVLESIFNRSSSFANSTNESGGQVRLPEAPASLPPAADADASLVLRDKAERILAHCSLWWSNTPNLNMAKVGFVGNFFAVGADEASRLLDLAASHLSRHGCDLAIGPVNGNTWRQYRFVTQGHHLHAPFFLEPVNTPAYPQFFINSGFSVLSNYYSTISDCLVPADARKFGDRLYNRAVTLRQLDIDNIDAELELLYELCSRSFLSNFLYQPISKAEFLDLYKPLLPILDARLVLIAEHAGQAAGFILLLPNRLPLQQEDRGETIIVKTAARLPDRYFSGLGSLMLLEAQERAKQLGYTRVIHALMHETNASLAICRKYAKIMRKYSLFERQL